MSKLLAKFKALLSPANRAIIYRVALVAVPALAAAGALTSGQASSVLYWAGIILGGGTTALAAAHTPIGGPKPPDPPAKPASAVYDLAHPPAPPTTTGSPEVKP